MERKLKLAIQKKGRLADKSMQLLRNCGLEIENYKERLITSARNFPIEILFLRDDDIPEYVQDGVADLGIVGENVLLEKEAEVKLIKKLGFGKCTLRIALRENEELNSPSELKGKTIATSYPNILGNYLKENEIEAKVIEISGSVEIAPSLGIADYICDLVSTGNTLKLNKLKKSFSVLESEAILVKNKDLKLDKELYPKFKSLLERIESALNAKKSKYIMMNVPKEKLESVITIIPSLSSPTVLSLAEADSVAVHAVIPSDTFWDITDDLKNAGASGILVLPIENIIL